MINCQSPVTHFNDLSLEDLSLKVAELEALLMVLNDMGTLDGIQAGNVASAAERLAHWLQADLQAMIPSYNSQRCTEKSTYTTPIGALVDNLQCQFEEMRTGYLTGRVNAEGFIESMDLLGETVAELHARQQMAQWGEA